jgi:hypothetical protein
VVLLISICAIFVALSGFVHSTKWSVPSPSDIKDIDGIYTNGFPLAFVKGRDGKNISLSCVPFSTRIGETCLPPASTLYGRFVHATYFIPKDPSFPKNRGIMLSFSFGGYEYANQKDRIDFLRKIEDGGNSFDSTQFVLLVGAVPFFIMALMNIIKSIRK